MSKTDDHNAVNTNTEKELETLKDSLKSSKQNGHPPEDLHERHQGNSKQKHKNTGKGMKL